MGSIESTGADHSGYMPTVAAYPSYPERRDPAFYGAWADPLPLEERTPGLGEDIAVVYVTGLRHGHEVIGQPLDDRQVGPLPGPEDVEAFRAALLAAGLSDAALTDETTLAAMMGVLGANHPVDATTESPAEYAWPHSRVPDTQPYLSLSELMRRTGIGRGQTTESVMRQAILGVRAADLIKADQAPGLLAPLPFTQIIRVGDALSLGIHQGRVPDVLAAMRAIVRNGTPTENQ